MESTNLYQTRRNAPPSNSKVVFICYVFSVDLLMFDTVKPTVGNHLVLFTILAEIFGLATLIVLL